MERLVIRFRVSVQPGADAPYPTRSGHNSPSVDNQSVKINDPDTRQTDVQHL